MEGLGKEFFSLCSVVHFSFRRFPVQSLGRIFLTVDLDNCKTCIYLCSYGEIQRVVNWGFLGSRSVVLSVAVTWEESLLFMLALYEVHLWCSVGGIQLRRRRVCIVCLSCVFIFLSSTVVVGTSGGSLGVFDVFGAKFYRFSCAHFGCI